MDGSSPLTLRVLTPNGVFFNKGVRQVTVKTTEGYMGILPNHVPVVAAIAISEMHITTSQNERRVCAVSGGLLCVTQTQVTIITDAVEFSENIDLGRAERALARAREAIQSKTAAATEFATKLAFDRALNRVNLKKQHH